MSTADRAWLLLGGRTLFGLVFIIAGTLIMWDGVATVKSLWTQYSPYLPFSLPPDIGLKTQKSTPLIFVTFVRVVSSLIAVIIGGIWIISGLSETLGSLRKDSEVTDFKAEGTVAESLRTGEAQYWKEYSFFVKKLSEMWGQARALSPLSYEIIGVIAKSCVKILFLGVFIFLTYSGLRALPALISKYLHSSVTYYVPAPTSLYALIGVVLVINLIIMITQFPLQRRSFSRSSHRFSVYGTGAPNMFLAMFEEGGKLLNPKDFPAKRPIRLKSMESPQVSGALLETSIRAVRTTSGLAIYLYLPLIILFTSFGFSRLTHFNKPVIEMPYSEFLKLHFFAYVLEVALGIGLILAGIYFAEWARRLFDCRRYRSTLIFAGQQSPTPNEQSESIHWMEESEADEGFASWARSPDVQTSFDMEVYWASALSESTSPGAPRFLSQLDLEPSSDETIIKIIEMPFHTSFGPTPQYFRKEASNKGEKVSEKEEKNVEWSIE